MADGRDVSESRWYEDQTREHPKLEPGFVTLSHGGVALEA